MEELFKNKTRYTKKEYDLFLEEYRKEFAMSENIYVWFNIIFFFFCLCYSFYTKEFVFGFIILIGLIFFIWYEFVRPIKNVKKNRESDKVNGDFVNTYTFYKNYFGVKNPDGEAQLFYFKLYRVTETKTHFYIYISREYAFLVAKNGFKDNKSEEFSKFIKKKVWRKYRNRITR